MSCVRLVSLSSLNPPRGAISTCPLFWLPSLPCLSFLVPMRVICIYILILGSVFVESQARAPLPSCFPKSWCFLQIAFWMTHVHIQLDKCKILCLAFSLKPTILPSPQFSSYTVPLVTEGRKAESRNYPPMFLTAASTYLSNSISRRAMLCCP